MIGIVWVLASNPPWLFAFDVKQIPDFADGQWICQEIKKESEGTPSVIWGMSRQCYLGADASVIGTEVYAFESSVSFYKRWKKGANEPFHALYVADKWINFGIANVEASVFADTKAGIAVKVLFELWNEEGSAAFSMVNPAYPWLEQAVEGKE